jgi:hydroxysqualene synthase
VSAALDTLENVEIWSGKDRGDENFPVGSALIAKRLRPHVHAYYAFARNADDIADSAVLGAAEKIARLDVMEDVLLGRRETGSPSALRLRASLRETGLSPVNSTDLLIAFRRDATKLRYANWDELVDYCRYSANPVGRQVLLLHGESPDTFAASDALCTLLQVLNHLQDCAKDLRDLDRCYLPQDLMAANGTRIDDLVRERETPGLRGAFAALLDRCRELNGTAWDLPRRTRDRRLRLETAVIAGLAARLCRRLTVGDPIAGRVKLTKADMAASLAGALKFLA